MNKLLFRAAGTVAALLPVAVFACTLCYSETAQKVRAAIFGDDLWQNIGLTSLPFLVVLLIVALVYLGTPRRRPHMEPPGRRTPPSEETR